LSKSSIQWLIRDEKGNIKGPFSTEEILKQIRMSQISGVESVCRYPGKKWIGISHESRFFDALIESLENEMAPSSGDQSSISNISKYEIQSTKKEPKKSRDWGDTIHKTKVGVPKNGAKKPNVKKHSKNRRDFGQSQGRVISAAEEEAIAKNEIEEQRKEQKKKKRDKNRKTQEELLQKRKQKQQKIKNEKLRRKRGQLRRFALVLIFSLLAAIVYLLFEDEEKNEPTYIAVGQQNQLLRPKFGQKTEGIDSNEFFSTARSLFSKGTTKSYLKAQKYLIPVVQVTKSPEPFLYLCLVYKELWDFSYKDSRDYDTLVSVARRVQKLAPKSRPARVCNLTLMLANGKYEKSLKYSEVILTQDPSSVFYNMIAGEIFLERNDPAVALFYFNRAAESWGRGDVWAKLFLNSAKAFFMQKKIKEGIGQIDRLLQIYPDHATGLIEKGIVEFSVFENLINAKQYITNGLEKKNPIGNRLKSEAYYVLGKIALKQGDQSRALRFAKIAFLTNSTNPNARELVLSLGGIRALGNIKIDNQNIIFVGEQLMKRGLYTEAQAEYRAAFDANPRNGFAALRAAEALWKLNQGKEAITWARKAVKVDSKLIRGYVVLSDFLSARYDFKNAIAALRQASKTKRDHPDVWKGLALVEFRRRNYPMAIAFSKRALGIYPTDTETLIIKAKSHKESREFNKAKEAIEQAAEYDPSDESIQGVFGEIIRAQQGPNAGEAYFEVLIQRRPKSILFRRLLGKIMSEEQKYDEAIEVFREALSLNPDDKETLLEMGKTLQLTGDKMDMESARNYFLDAATIDPTDAEPLFLLGQLYLDSGQYLESQEQFARVLQINDRYPLGNYFAGKAYLGLKNYDKSLEMAQKEKEINPGVAEPYLLSGQIYYSRSLNDKDGESLLGSSYATQCTKEYRGAISKGAKTSDAYLSLGRCYRLMGDFDSAEGMLDEAKDLESGNSQIYREQGAIYEVQGKVDAAIESYEKYLRLSPEAKDATQIQSRTIQLKQRGQEEP